jgi:hypothetical protein
VKLRGIVTFCESQWPSLIIQEDTNAAAFVHPTPGAVFNPGDVVEIEGQCREGFKPQIYASSVRKIGQAELPPPMPTTFEELATGRYDSLRVRVSTTVRWMHVTFDRLYLYVSEASGRFEVHIPNYKGELPIHLMDARVELTGVTGTKLDSHGKLTGAGMSLPRIDDVRVLEPGPNDVWQRPSQVINTLMYFHPSISFGQKTKVSGVVTLITPSGQLYVEDSSGGVVVNLPPFRERPDTAGKYLDSPLPAGLKMGDQVDVVAYPAIGSYAPVLMDASVRKVGSTVLPQPHLVAATNVLTSILNSRRIRLDGHVLANEVRPSRTGVLQRLTLEDNSIIFFAEYEGEKPLNAPQNSQVELTGICSFEVDQQRRPISFRVQVGRAEDLRILQGPPLITTRRLLQFGTPLAIIVLGWVWLLRRQVQLRRSDLRRVVDELQREVEQRKHAGRPGGTGGPDAASDRYRPGCGDCHGRRRDHTWLECAGREDLRLAIGRGRRQIPVRDYHSHR